MARHVIPADLKPENIVCLIDRREQCPLDLAPLAVDMATLATGDYSIRGLEHIVAIERKGLSDLLECVGRERERFEKEIQRLLAYPCRALVVEATWRDIEIGDWRGDITPAQALGSLLGWIVAGVPVLMAGDHERAGRYVARMLLLAARRRWRESRNLLAVLDEPKLEEEACQDKNKQA